MERKKETFFLSHLVVLCEKVFYASHIALNKNFCFSTADACSMMVKNKKQAKNCLTVLNSFFTLKHILW